MTNAETDWERLQRVYFQALALEPGARPAFLDASCHGDQSLKERVERMLESASSDSFLRDPADRARWAPVGGAGDNPRAWLDDMAAASGRYALVRYIGAGGMGVVGEALDTVRRCRVALKSLARLGPSAIAQFKREFRTLAGISHPNLVALYELFGADDRWLLSMEFVEGTDFLSYVRSRPDGGCDDARLRAALPQLIEAVQHLHHNGIVHRDLKPGNVKVTDTGRLVVLDFGLAAELSRDPDSRATDDRFGGTAPYMSPEQARGEPTGPASDWYAVGVMLYEALTGRRPFDGPLPRMLFDKQAGHPQRPGTLAAGVPADLEDLCLAWLSQAPHQRPVGPGRYLELASPPTNLSANTPLTPPGGFIGRRRELALLEHALEELGQGPTVVRVHGPSGMGKTALFEAFKTVARARPGTLVFDGRCYEHESVPYKAFDGLLDQTALFLRRLAPEDAVTLVPRNGEALRRVFPVFRQVRAIEGRESVPIDEGQIELRQRAFVAFRELLAGLSGRWRLVLCIDDLQWADADSASLLREVLRAPAAPHLLLVAGYRSDHDRSPVVGFLSTRRAATRDVEIALGPLSRGEVAELATQIAGPEWATRDLGSLAQDSGGNPYFVIELAADAQPGPNLDALIWARARQLSPRALALVGLVSIAGQPISEAEACEAADLESQDPALLAVLRSTRFIRGAGADSAREIECWHDRVREAIALRLPADVQRQHHVRLAQVLESTRPTESERIARHYEGAGDLRAAGTHFGRAAQASADTLAFDRAADLFRKAVDLAAPAAEERRRLLLGLAHTLANAGRGPEAARAFEEAALAFAPIAHLAPEEAAQLFECQRRAAYWYTNSGHSREGRPLLAQILRRVGLKLPSSPLQALFGLLRAEAWLRMRRLAFRERRETEIAREVLDQVDAAKDAAGALITADIVTGAYLNAHGLVMALDAGEPNRIAYMMMVQVATAAMVGPVARARRERYRRRAATLEARVSDPVVRASFQWGDGLSAFFDGRFAAAVPLLERGAHILRHECRGETREAAQAEVCMHFARMYIGQYGRVFEEAATASASALARGDLFLGAAASVCHAQVALFVDSAEVASSALDRAAAHWQEPGYHTIHAQMALTRVRIELFRGDAAGATALLEREWPNLRRHLYLWTEHFWQWCYFTRASVRLTSAVGAGAARCVAAAARDAAKLERDSLTWSRPLAALIRAGCAARRGDPDDARRWLKAAIDASADMRLVEAAARLRLGTLDKNRSGAELARRATALMEREGVRNPAGLAAVFSPGF